MLKKVWSIFLVLFIVHSLWFMVCWAQPLSSTDLINNAKLYNGKTVVYEGEVIGDVMVRGEYAWINVNDGKNALGVWINKSLVKDILYTGSYKSKGDWVEITGAFQNVCLQHGGDLDIHAQAMRKLASGRPIHEKLNPSKLNMVIVLSLVWGGIWILTPFRRK
jgi:hypothetical protein